jgi:hypothetical protein
LAIKLKTLSEVLKFLMVQNRQYLLLQKGKPPIGKCLDCKRDILAMEMAAECTKCGVGASGLVCYKCVDRHDHITIDDLMKLPALAGAPN